MSVFNLYNEIEQELHFLLPKRGMMLIVFHLYHRMKEHAENALAKIKNGKMIS